MAELSFRRERDCSAVFRRGDHGEDVRSEETCDDGTVAASGRYSLLGGESGRASRETVIIATRTQFGV